MKELVHLNWAAWTSMDTAVVSFTRDWTSRKLPQLWFGEDQLKLEGLKRLDPEHFGIHGGYYGKGGKIHFVLPRELTKELDIKGGLFVAGSFNGWEEAIGDSNWKMSNGTVRGKPCHVLSVPQASLDQEEAATFKFVTGKKHWLEVPEDTANAHVDGFGIKNYLFSSHRSGRHLFRFETPLPLNQSEGRLLYFKVDGVVDSIRLSPGVFLKSLEAKGPLGAIVNDNTTSFRIFAPRAIKVNLFLFQDLDGPEGDPIPLKLTDDLVWEAHVEGNLHGWFYHYTVEAKETDEVGFFDPEFRIPDPYAKAVCGPMGPGIVVDDSFFEREDDGFKAAHWHDLVIAEAHVRDLTATAPVEMSDEERLGFRGLKKWIDDKSFYLSELGVNAVELQPVHEFDTLDKEQYAWGYMPVNYFAPASQYCKDASSLDQIGEFRELVKSFHGKGMAVILDVVYNHFGEPNFLQYLDREYYFLLTEDGHYENYSGCGNTLDANTPMVRRLMRDSLIHWMEAFGVDGFRFDLGELLGKETLAWLETELKAVKPEVILIAEPWSFRGHIAGELRETGFASWNDGYREYMREYLTLHANADRLGYFMQGSSPDWSRFPAQTVNYVESHDDRCWIDKITENGGHDGHRPTANDRRRTHLMIGMQMMSLGIPMLSSGMDMLKSKGGTNNTYLRGDLNAIPYTRMTEYSGTVDYFRKWIAFRMGPLGRYLRLDEFPGSDYFMTSQHEHLFGMIYNALRTHGRERLLYVVNPGYEFEELRFPEQDLDRFEQLADSERWGDPMLAGPHFERAGERIVIPPLSCGLFIERL
ncbi:glycoside hydrolase family 1 [Puniceicoccales bacterium CK1056]|uniref:Glycoside hydrolase family 1 n=1 Tax=Oceanipulchritudo coccoides TaxID=2706888 RepID=A0A6B2LZY8_9BACT|nr:alpha-amylase family glycosyl hydrolase [Oceanipulchritudo coccoides]NDV61065.1 glycoside hydrolase family 1 [Oceanipulchritudo coccoides]